MSCDDSFIALCSLNAGGGGGGDDGGAGVSSVLEKVSALRSMVDEVSALVADKVSALSSDVADMKESFSRDRPAKRSTFVLLSRDLHLSYSLD